MANLLRKTMRYDGISLKRANFLLGFAALMAAGDGNIWRPSRFVRRRSPLSKAPCIKENNEMAETFIRPIEKAPTNTDLCVFGEDNFGLYQIPFACRLEAGRWINAQRRDQIKITPVGWKPWAERDRRIGRPKYQPTLPFNFGLRPS
jgi:hypothetical protein